MPQVVGSVLRAFAAQWRDAGPAQQYSVAEAPTEAEAFLTRWDA